MKKALVLIFLFILVVASSSCSRISESEHQTVLNKVTELQNQVSSLNNENSNLQQRVDKLTASNIELQKRYDQLTADSDTVITLYNKANNSNSVLKRALVNTYDAYRGMLLYVTLELYGNGLSKSDWEKYVTDLPDSIPTFEKIKELVN